MAVWTADAVLHTDSIVATTDGFQGAAGLSGSAADAVSSSGKLINFASVILQAPLYAGIGGIFDPDFDWPFNAPVVGSKVFYDPTFITVRVNGEIVSTNNNCSAEIQYFDGVNVNEVDVFITPFMVGYARTRVSASGQITGGLLGAAADIVTALGSLTTNIALQAAAADASSAIAALSTAIRLAGAAFDSATATGTMFGTPAALAGAAADSASAQAALNTQIQLNAAAANVSSALGTLATMINLAGAGIVTSSAQGSLSGVISLSGLAADLITAAGRIGDLIEPAEILIFPAANRTFRLQ